ncbi:MAG TPA: ester cyclase [Pyrinomonadaceae bacterium]|jgi:predicted ester cyclase
MNEAVDALEQAGQRWNAGDLSGYLQLYDEGVILHGYAGVEPGLASVRRFYEGFWLAFPGSRLTFEDVFASGDRVACRFLVEGVHAGHFLGLEPTSRPISLPGLTILRFRGRRCIERWSQADFLGLLTQLGAVSPPG